ncbi:MAG TPA: hypothetical protein VF011_09430 [Terriglobales bacterium]
MRQRRIEVADSEPRWLTAEQYRECVDGGIELLPWNARELMSYARQQSLRLVGMIVINDEGDYWDYVDENSLPENDRDFALRVFHVTVTVSSTEVMASLPNGLVMDSPTLMSPSIPEYREAGSSCEWVFSRIPMWHKAHCEFWPGPLRNVTALQKLATPN